MMIIDAHTHIFPGKIRKNREKYFTDEPAFKKLYQSPKSRLIGAREMLGPRNILCMIFQSGPVQEPSLFAGLPIFSKNTIRNFLPAGKGLKEI